MGIKVRRIVPIPEPFCIILFRLCFIGTFFLDMSSKLLTFGLIIRLILDFWDLERVKFSFSLYSRLYIDSEIISMELSLRYLKDIPLFPDFRGTIHLNKIWSSLTLPKGDFLGFKMVSC